MIRCNPRAWLLLGCGGLLLATASARAEVFHCERGEMRRSVEIRYEEPGQPVPCAVVYHKETEAPGREEVLWRADFDVGFCEGHARDLIERLSRAGWACTAADDAAGKAPATSGPPATRPAPSPPDPAPAPGSLLEAAVARDLERLRELATSEVEAGPGRFGDLDGDGRADAALIFTFAGRTGEEARYLAAYLFDGGTYRLTASRSVGGDDPAIEDGAVEAVEDRMIVVRLGVREPGDAACCPSGERRIGFTLRDNELVRVDSVPSQ